MNCLIAEKIKARRFTLAGFLAHRIGSGADPMSWTPFNNSFFVARRLVAATLPARDPAAVVPFNRGSLHAAALPWADADTTWADANCGVGIVPATVPVVAVVAVPPDLNIDLGHLDALGIGRNDGRGSRQHRCGWLHREKSLQHVGVLLGLIQRARTLRVPPGQSGKDGVARRIVSGTRGSVRKYSAWAAVCGPTGRPSGTA